ncbi:MAG: HTTM domain-containing protein [Myxococcales bacterium]
MTARAQDDLPALMELGRALDRWLHASVDARRLAFHRIALASLFVLDLLLAIPHVDMWWTDGGVLPLTQRKLFAPAGTLSLLDWLPSTPNVVWTCWAIALGQGVLLALGAATRLQAICVFVWAVSFDFRNAMILDGGDKIFRILLFLTIFMRSSEVWSLDAFVRRRRGLAVATEVDGWCLRLVQVQMAALLWSAGVEKLSGTMWREGTAMYFILHLDDFAMHGPIPDFLRESLLFSRLTTWGSLLLEILAPLLVWFRETRRLALLAILMLHLGIEYAMNIYLFEWIMLVGWAAHVTADDVRECAKFIQQFGKRREFRTRNENLIQPSSPVVEHGRPGELR